MPRRDSDRGRKLSPHRWPPPAILRSNRALARTLGVDESAVRKAEREGRIHRTLDGAWDVAAVRLAWESSATRTTRTDGKAPDDLDDTTLLALKKRREAIRIEREQMQLDEAKGQLIRVDKAVEDIQTWARILRDLALALPDSKADEFAVAVGAEPRVVAFELQQLMRDFCHEAADTAVYFSRRREGVNGLGERVDPDTGKPLPPPADAPLPGVTLAVVRERQLRERCEAVRDCPARIAPGLAAELGVDVDRLQRALERELRELLEVMARAGSRGEPSESSAT